MRVNQPGLQQDRATAMIEHGASAQSILAVQSMQVCCQSHVVNSSQRALVCARTAVL